MSLSRPISLLFFIHFQASIATRDARTDQIWLDETIGDLFHQDDGRQPMVLTQSAIGGKPSERVAGGQVNLKTLDEFPNDGLSVARESHVPVVDTLTNVDAHTHASNAGEPATRSPALPLPFQPLPFQSDGGNPIVAAGSVNSHTTLAKAAPIETKKAYSADMPLPFQPLPFQPSSSQDGSSIVTEAPWPLPFQGMEKDTLHKEATVIALPREEAKVPARASTAMIHDASPALLSIAAKDVLFAMNTTMNITTTPKITKAGAATNVVGDGNYFMINVCFTLGIILICFCLFSCCRLAFKPVYSSRSEVEYPPYNKPNPVSGSLTGWIGNSLGMKPLLIADVAGIDQAMMISYIELCVKILGLLALPLVLVEIPVNIYLGGNAAGEDHLSWQGMANVKDDLPYIYWLYAILVIYVVCITEMMIFRGMRDFIKIRFKWLDVLTPTRAQTILVDGVPSELCTDTQVKHYFERAVDGPYVAQATLVKRSGTDVKNLYQDLKKNQSGLQISQKQFARTGQRPQLDGAQQLDAGSYHQEQIDQLQDRLVVAQKNLLSHAAVENSGINYNRGFVTFNKMSACAAALNMTYNEDQDLFIVSAAPAPNDVHYEGLMVGNSEIWFRAFIGYILVLVVFMIFLFPFMFISTHTLSSDLVDDIPGLKGLLAPKSVMAYLYDGLFGSLAATVIISILPSLLMFIFHTCFVLKSYTEAQFLCQRCLFCIAFVYILMVISIGSSLASDAKELAKHPTAIFSLLAKSLPESSHYYLNFVVFQSMAPTITLTRFANLIKFQFYKSTASEDHAKLMCEPEDQDYSGIGSRSARLTLIMVVTLAFCTLSPLIVVLGIFNFIFCRLSYGYLVSYSERPKPEYGGHFYVTQLQHTQAGLVFYLILMTGVLLQRAPNSYPAVLSACGFAPVIWSINRFSKLKWEGLPVHLVKEDDAKPFVLDESAYSQPELRPPQTSSVGL